MCIHPAIDNYKTDLGVILSNITAIINDLLFLFTLSHPPATDPQVRDVRPARIYLRICNFDNAVEWLLLALYQTLLIFLF